MDAGTCRFPWSQCSGAGVPDDYWPRDIDRFHDRLAGQRAQVAFGPWFRDGGHVFRLGFACESANGLEKRMGIISGAFDADPA